MRIAFFIDSMNGFGGAQRVISVLCNALSKYNDNEVMVILSGNTDDSVYPLENVKRYAYDQSSGGVLGKIKKIASIRKATIKFKPDVAVSFLSMTNVMTIIALSFTGIPLIISERNDPDKASNKEKKLSKCFYRYASAVVVQTDDIKKKISRIFKKEIAIIPNPLQNFDYEKTEYINSKKIVAVGRINEQKNYPMMLRAFKLFLKEHEGYNLHIYGTGDKISQYENLAKELGILDNVHFLGNKQDPLLYELDAEMYIMTSDFEGMPNALAEAMSVGFPCISTVCDGGGAAYLINNEENGLLVEKGNEAEFAKAMKRIAEDENFAKKLGLNAKRLKEMLNTDAVTQTWTDFINKYKR